MTTSTHLYTITLPLYMSVVREWQTTHLAQAMGFIAAFKKPGVMDTFIFGSQPYEGEAFDLKQTKTP